VEFGPFVLYTDATGTARGSLPNVLSTRTPFLANDNNYP
jgi:hypothetical protein